MVCIYIQLHDVKENFAPWLYLFPKTRKNFSKKMSSERVMNNLGLHTHEDKNLHTILVKHFNDLLDGQKSQRSIVKVTYFYVGDLFCIHLGTKYANFQEKIFADISGRKLQTLCIT